MNTLTPQRIFSIKVELPLTEQVVISLNNCFSTGSTTLIYCSRALSTSLSKRKDVIKRSALDYSQTKFTQISMPTK